MRSQKIWSKINNTIMDMKSKCLFFILVCFSLNSFSQNGFKNNAIISFPEIKLDSNIEAKFKNVVSELEWPKDSIVFDVGIYKSEEGYYFFLRPFYINNMPDFEDYNVYGFCKIEKVIFLFGRIYDERLMKKGVVSSNIFDKDIAFKDKDDYFLLCDGCSFIQRTIVKGIPILIKAEMRKRSSNRE